MLLLAGGGSFVWASPSAVAPTQQGLVATSLPVTSTSLAQITLEPELQQALIYLAQGPGVGALRRIITLPIKLVFKNMASFGNTYAQFDAMAWMSAGGQVYIFVNQKHRGAPPAALAALLAHEAIHHDAFNSLTEEIEGWQQEAITWAYWQHQQPALQQPYLAQNYPLVKRLNALKEAHWQGTLPDLVRNNRGYAQLSETSPAALAHRFK